MPFSLTLIFLVCISTSADCQSLDLYFHAQGGSSGSYLGGNIAGIGDVNHDGFDDIAIMASGDGHTYIYYGNNYRDSIPDLALPVTGNVLAGLGDINNDSYPDIALGSHTEIYIYYGNASTLDTLPGDTIRPAYTPPASFPSFGDGFTTGDFDGDGIIDFVVTDGNPGGPPEIFYQLLFYSGAAGIGGPPTWTLDATDNQHIYFQCCAVNLDSDATKELVVGVQGYGTDFPPRLIVFDGPNFDSTPELEFFVPAETPTAAKSFFGFELIDIGDFNGDGYDDLCAPAGWVGYIFYGGPGIWDSIPDRTLNTEASRVALAGDVNVEGRADIVVGNLGYNGEDGRVEIFLGEPPGDTSMDYWMGKTELPPHSLENIGRSVAPAGDFDNDGAADVIVVADNLGSAFYGDVFVLGLHQVNSGILDPSGPEIDAAAEFSLSSYPNPTNSAAVIRVTSPSSNLSIKIFDVLGRQVTTLSSDGHFPSSGTREYLWDGHAQDGSVVASGVYFAVARAAGMSRSTKIVILR